MKTNREQNGTVPLQGNLLRLSGRREIAIYLRDGAAWVADFNNGRGEPFSASAWYSMYGMSGGRMLVHSQRRGEVETISPLPEEVVQRIEALHQRNQRIARPVIGPAVRRALASLVAVFRHLRSSVQPY